MVLHDNLDLAQTIMMTKFQGVRMKKGLSASLLIYT